MKSVAKPGIINKIAANAITALGLIHMQVWFLTIFVNPDLIVFKPSCFA